MWDGGSRLKREIEIDKDRRRESGRRLEKVGGDFKGIKREEE